MRTYSMEHADGIRRWQLERMPPKSKWSWQFYVGGVWLTRLDWYLTLLFMPFDGISGYKWRQVRGRTI